MRVICIDGKPTKPICSISLPEGITLDAAQSDYADDCYIVAGYEKCPVSGFRIHWLKSRIIPLSNIDETEMHREYNSQTTKANTP